MTVSSGLSGVLRRRHGPRTAELARTSGGFGLGQVPTRIAPERTTSMVCGYCSTGCSLDVHVVDGQAVNLTPTVDHPVNLGMACPKGWESLTPMEAPDRATMPMVRRRRGGPLEPVPWEEALDTFVTRMKQVQAEHGPESVAFLSTGQMPTEEMALLGALGRFGMGIRHCDGNTRQCMATAVVAYKQAFGFDAPPYTYADFEESDVIVLVGSNLAITHPIMWERIARNPHDPEIIVLDPRRTETAVAATQHHALAPKSDLELLYGVAHLLLRWGAIDKDFIREHTTGFDAFETHLRAFTPERAADASGLPVEDVERLASTIADGERVSYWWTMGVNQSHQGVRTAQALIDLALMTGSIGRPGTGANSITGQCNAMGSRLFSNTTGLLGGHDFADPDHRAKVAGVLGVDASRIPDAGGWAYDQIMEGIASGDIRGLWVIATNTAHSWVNSSEARELLDRLDFLAVQDLYADTETAAHADLVLPAAGWGEKEGTFINSERRLGVIKQVRRAPGQALADFWIFKLIAEAWGCGELFERWESPEATFRLLAELTEGQPCDVTGVQSYAQIDEARGIQWPFPAGTATAEPERRLFADGHFPTPDGRARFLFDEPQRLPEPTDLRYPLALLTGRGSSSQWHTQTRTRRSDILRSLAPDRLLLEIAPADAAAIGIQPGEEVVVESRRGSIRAIVQPMPTVQPGHVFLPMHEDATNILTFPRVDPHSRQPAYKHAAVLVRPLHRWER
ncbi:MAG TPA: nitrate reductase [Acidimicrobiales bacterium]|nr:nitrate reductase [Acidimicrobiales bacterium]